MYMKTEISWLRVLQDATPQGFHSQKSFSKQCFSVELVWNFSDRFYPVVHYGRDTHNQSSKTLCNLYWDFWWSGGFWKASVVGVTSNVSTVTRDFWGRIILQNTLRAPILHSKKKQNVTNAKKYSVTERSCQGMTFSCTALKHFSATYVRRSFHFKASLRYTRGENIWNRETFLAKSVQKSFSAKQMWGHITLKFTVTTSRINATYAPQNLREIQPGVITENPICALKPLHALSVKRSSNTNQAPRSAWNRMKRLISPCLLVLLKTVVCPWPQRQDWKATLRNMVRESGSLAIFAQSLCLESLNWTGTWNMCTGTQRENLNA